MIQLYFEQTKPDKDGNCKRYKVLAFGPAVINGKDVAETVTLQGSGPHKFVEPFDKAKLDSLYKNKADYVNRIRVAARAAQAQVFLLPEDAAVIINAAAETTILDEPAPIGPPR